MRIIAYESSRATLLFPLEEVVPIGGANGRQLVDEIKERYQFLRMPDLATIRPQEGAQQGYKFEAGRFENANIIEFSIFTDGLVGTASTTEIAEAFLNDLVQWIRERFGFREFTVEPRRLYHSQVVVEFDHKLSNLIPKFQGIISCITARLSPIYKIDTLVDLSRIDFEWDKTVVTLPVPVPRFIIERRVGTPFDRERFFSSAPMKTSDHVQVLEEIERFAS